MDKLLIIVMTLPQELQTQIVNRVQQCYELAEQSLDKTFPFPKIQFNQRGKIAGAAHLQTNLLKFNPTLLADNLEHFIDEVVPHEVSHLLVFQLFGKVRPHGSEWRQIMSGVFNVEPNTRHSLDVTKVAGETFDYACKCGTVALSVRRHNKIIRGKQRYFCKQCGSTLIQSLANN